MLNGLLGLVQTAEALAGSLTLSKRAIGAYNRRAEDKRGNKRRNKQRNELLQCNAMRCYTARHDAIEGFNMCLLTFPFLWRARLPALAGRVSEEVSSGIEEASAQHRCRTFGVVEGPWMYGVD